MSGKMRFNPRAGAPGVGGLLKDGFKHLSGLEEAILKNIEACGQLSEMTRTSLGPNGMNKLVINHLERLFVTGDAATLCTELEVQHPAAKMIVMAAKMQEHEMGDATNFVVTFAGELLMKAEELLRQGVHPSDIVAGYTRAAEKAQEVLAGLKVEGKDVSEPRDVPTLTAALKTVVAAKQFGYEDMLAPLIAEAAATVMARPPKGAALNTDNVRVAKLLGGSLMDSRVVRGVVALRDTEGSVKNVTDAKIAVYSCGVEASSTEAKGTVLIESAEELKKYNKSEEESMATTIKGLTDAGINVVVSGGSISEVAMHFLEQAGILVVKIMSKFELRRLCRAVGATAMVRVGPPTPEEVGYASSVGVQELSSKRVTVFAAQGEPDEAGDIKKGGGISTIVLRGATPNVLDDMERSIDDAVAVAKALTRDGSLVPGAGASEIAVAAGLKELADAEPGLEQYAIKAYAEALEVVPRTLSENSGQDATDIIASLYAAHAAGRSDAGVDVEEGGVVGAVEAGVLDCYSVKESALRLSSDAAITIMRVDQIIMSKQAGGPKPRKPGAPDM